MGTNYLKIECFVPKRDCGSKRVNDLPGTFYDIAWCMGTYYLLLLLLLFIHSCLAVRKLPD